MSTLLQDLDISISSTYTVITAQPTKCEHDFSVFYLTWIKSYCTMEPYAAHCFAQQLFAPLSLALFIMTHWRLLLQECELQKLSS